MKRYLYPEAEQEEEVSSIRLLTRFFFCSLGELTIDEEL